MYKEKIHAFWLAMILLLSTFFLQYLYPILKEGAYWWVWSILQLMLGLILIYLWPYLVLGLLLTRASIMKPELKERMKKQFEYMASGRYQKFLVLMWVLGVSGGLLVLVAVPYKGPWGQFIFGQFVSPTILLGALTISLRKFKTIGVSNSSTIDTKVT